MTNYIQQHFITLFVMDESSLQL